MPNLPQSGVALVAQGSAAYFGDMSKATNATNAFGGSIDAAARQVQAFGANVEKHQAKIGSLTTRLDEQRRAFAILQQEVDQTTQRYGAGTVQAQKKQLALDKLSNAIKTTEGHLTDEQKALAGEEQALKEAQGVLATHTAKTVELGGASKDAVKPIAQLGGATAETGQSFKRAGKDAESFTDTAGKGFSAFSEIAIGALRRVGELLTDVFRDAGKAAIGFVKDSIGVAGDFEAGMNRFGAAAGGSLEDAGVKLEDFRDLFIDIGKELPVSTAEVQDAAIELVKGGLDPLILKTGGLKDAIQFAAAAELGLADAATISVKQLGVWTKATATAEEQTAFLAMSQDLMVRAAGASTVNVDNLARAMNNAGGQARALNLDYKDFVTGVTLIAPAFSSAEQAGTGFNVFLKQLQPSTAPATEAMHDLNLMTTNTTKIMEFLVKQGIQPLGTDLDTLGNQFTEFATAQGFTQKATQKLWDSFATSVFFDMEGKFVGVAKAAEILKNATVDLTDADKARYLQTIFGIDGMVAANTLIQAGAEGYDILAQKIDRASGVQAAAAARQAGYNTAMDNFKGSIEALQITAGTTLLPLLTNLLNNVLAPGVNVITGFVDALGKGVTPVQALRDALKPVTDSVNAVLPGFAAFAHLLQTGEATAGGWARIAGMFRSLFGEDIGKSITEVVRDVTEFVTSVQRAITTLQPVFGTLTVLFRDGEASAAGWARMGNVLQRVFGEELGSSIQDTIKVITDVINSFRSGGSSAQELGKILGDVGKIWDEYSTTVISNVQAIWGIVQSVFGVVRTFLQNNGTEIRAFFKETWDSISTIITTALQLIRGLVMGVFLVIRDFLNEHGEDIQRILKNAWTIISNVIGGALDIIKGVLTAALKIFQGDWSGAWEAIRTMSESVVKRIWEVIKAALDLIANFFGTTLSEIGNTWKQNFENYWKITVDMGKRLYNAGKALIENLWDGVKKKWEEFKAWLEEQWQAVRDMLPGSEPRDTSSPLYQLNDAGAAIITNLLKGLKDALPGLMDYVDGITDDIRQQFDDVADAITDTMSAIKRAQAGGYRTQASNLEKLAEFADTSDIQKEIADTEDRRYGLLLKLNEELAKGADANQMIVEQYKEQIALLEERKTALAKTEKDQTFLAQGLEDRLNSAFAEAQQQFTDPRDVMAYYDLLSNQAFEFADLQQQYYDAVAKGDTDRMERLSQQMLLVDRAQALEREAFIEQANKEDELTQLQQEIDALQSLTSVTGDMVEQVQAFFDSLKELLDIASGDSTAGYARGGFTQGGRAITVGEQGKELFVPQTDGWVVPHDLLSAFTRQAAPSASAQQIMAGGTTNNYYGHVGNSYQMPVHTNQSPAVAQQGFWTMQALAS